LFFVEFQKEDDVSNVSFNPAVFQLSLARADNRGQGKQQPEPGVFGLELHKMKRADPVLNNRSSVNSASSTKWRHSSLDGQLQFSHVIPPEFPHSQHQNQSNAPESHTRAEPSAPKLTE